MATTEQVKLGKRIQKARDAGTNWSEIGSEFSVTPGRAQFLSLVAHYDANPDEMVKATPAKVKSLRQKDKLSWGKISAMTGEGEAALRTLYAEAGQDPHDRIGKGGRWPSNAEKPAKAPKAKAAKTKKAAKATGGVPIPEDTAAEDVASLIVGKNIQVAGSKGQSFKYKVMAVNTVGDSKGRLAISFTDMDGAQHNILASRVTKVGGR